MKALLLILLAAVAAPLPQSARAAAAPDDVARYLAGMPVRGSAVETLSRGAEWVEHATFFDDAWAKLDRRQLAPIRDWSANYLGNPGDRSPVYYMFSGPDFLYAHAFFPNASQYILCGTEPIGNVPDLSAIPPEALAFALANLRKSLSSLLSWSFFITKDMKVDLRQNQLSGTLPVLMVFLARSGCRIDAVENVSAGKNAPGVQIRFTGRDGNAQILTYLSTDLSDGPVKSSGFLRYCAQFGQGRSLLKAASYLMHEARFNSVREFLLAQSKVIVQDDSGIPLRYYDPARWQLRCFGAYLGPIDLFKQHYQPGFAELYERSNPPPLPFGFGYQVQPTRSNVVLATPR
ncbi:MAG TPA: hypothetical protein VF614_07330 [Chthoniobacteraceae bacterium]|jgi:hypothetical protein